MVPGGVRAAATGRHASRETLRTCIHDLADAGAGSAPTSNRDRPPHFSEDEECRIERAALGRGKKGAALDSRAALARASNLAGSLGKRVVPKTGLLPHGRGTRSLAHRGGLSLKRPQQNSLHRKALTREKHINDFSSQHRRVKCEIEAETGTTLTVDCIVNMDEAGIGNHARPRTCIGEAGRAVTIAALGSCAHITPMVVGTTTGEVRTTAAVLNRKHVPANATTVGTPAGTVVLASHAGHVNGAIFRWGVDHDVVPAREPGTPLLLITDSCGSHRTAEALQHPPEKGVVVALPPPYTADTTQPLVPGCPPPSRSPSSAGSGSSR